VKSNLQIRHNFVATSRNVTGKFLEAKSLDVANASLSEAALQLAPSGDYGPSAGRGVVPVQREVFINLQFQPAQ
jgi:hypothetical protein